MSTRHDPSSVARLGVRDGCVMNASMRTVVDRRTPPVSGRRGWVDGIPHCLRCGSLACSSDLPCLVVTGSGRPPVVGSGHVETGGRQ